MARDVCLIFAAMKTSKPKPHRRIAAGLACLLALTLAPANATWPPPPATGEELAVWRAMGETIAHDHASQPYKLWYFLSDFTAASFIASAMTDPEREDFCGLSAAQVQTMLTELKTVSAQPVALEDSIARSAGFKIAHKKNPRLRYFAMSRVVFDPAGTRAWLSIELNGTRGSIVRLDKESGEWRRTSRCGGWFMPE
jgi:hypothetical protein